MSKTIAFHFEIPDNMSPDEQWPYIFSQMFTHFDNYCTWSGKTTPTHDKAITLEVVEAVCKAKIRSMKPMREMEAR